MADHSRRLWALASVGIAVAALATLSMGSLGDNLVYYWSPTELAANGNPVGATVRLGGLVMPGTLDWSAERAEMRFRVTDGTTEIDVRCDGHPPQMFREGIGVVVEGQLEADGVFGTSRVMVKHSNEYRAPEDGEEHGDKGFGTMVEDS